MEGIFEITATLNEGNLPFMPRVQEMRIPFGDLNNPDDKTKFGTYQLLDKTGNGYAC